MGSIKNTLAINVAKIIKFGLKSLGRNATSLPGKTALKISPDILTELSKGYRTIIITGTNGKTQTTSFIKNIIRQKYNFVISNEEGANLFQGIISLFLSNYKKSNESEKFAVLEVDEATVKYVTKYIDPVAIVLTNVFIDQTERFADIQVTFDKIFDGIENTKNAKIVINGDCPTFLSREIKNKCIYYGFDMENTSKEMPNTDEHSCPKCKKELKYNSISYSNIGNYFCDCGFKRPKLDNSVKEIKKIDLNSSTFSINGDDFSIEKGGVYNIYNALAAYSCVKVLNIENYAIQKGFNISEEIFGRQKSIMVEDKELTVYLIKNPTGANQIFSLMEYIKEPFTLVAMLNNQPADGVNYSWIDQADFEKLKNTKYTKLFIGGMQRQALKDRFLKANFTEEEMSFMENTTTNVMDVIKNTKDEKVVVITSYTCLTGLEKHLKSLNLL